MGLNINWYPGHMKKTHEAIKKNLSLVDFVIEIIDARIPLSSSNPMIQDALEEKPKLILLNKSDLADEKATEEWVRYFSKGDTLAIPYNSLSNKNINKIVKAAEDLMKDKVTKQSEKGLNTGSFNAMVVGIPNVGKSTFINNISGKRALKVGNRPGVTKVNQWLRIHEKLNLLDTPGVLWPKFEKEEALNLAFTGAIKDEIMDVETLALKLIERLNSIDENILAERYGVGKGLTALESMEEIGRKRGALMKFGEVDYTKVAGIVLDEFRKGTLGRITLEQCNGKL